MLSFYDLINSIKIFAVAKPRQPAEALKSPNDRQSHALLKFKESKEPIQLEPSYVDQQLPSDLKSCRDRKSYAGFHRFQITKRPAVRV